MSKPLPLSILLLAALTLSQLGHLQAQDALDARGPIPVEAGDAQWGDAGAPVTLIMFSDLQCPYCGRAWTTLGTLRDRYGPDDLRIVFKHFPLDFHKQAKNAAVLAAVIQAQYGADKTRAYVTAVHETKLGDSKDLRAVLSRIGLSGALMNRLNDAAAKKRVDDDIALGKQIGISGTPAFFVNGTKLSGARPVDDFVAAIDGELGEANKLRSRGVAPADVSLARTKQNFQAPAAPTATSPEAPRDQKPGADDKAVWNVPVGKSPVDGQNDALVTLVVFTDFECPYCAKINPTLQQLRNKYGNDLRIVFKNNPLPFHKRAMPAAQLAMEAYLRKGNKGFWAAYDKLFANQDALDDGDLGRYARALGLSPTLTMAAIERSAHSALIREDVELADDVSVRGTPQSFVNGRHISGAQPLDRFVAVVDEELAAARKLVEGGVSRADLYAHIIKDGKTAPPPERVAIPAPSDKTPVLGNARAKVTMTVFLDFECPFCARVQPTIDKLMDHYGDQLRIAYRHHPLPHHIQAVPAHAAAAEAFRQGGNDAFWKMHDLIYADQRLLDVATLVGYAEQLGLDADQMQSAIDSQRHQPLIAADKRIAEKAGLSGTPAFVINGYKVSGAQSFERFKKVIDRALGEAK